MNNTQASIMLVLLGLIVAIALLGFVNLAEAVKDIKPPEHAPSHVAGQQSIQFCVEYPKNKKPTRENLFIIRCDQEDTSKSNFWMMVEVQEP